MRHSQVNTSQTTVSLVLQLQYTLAVCQSQCIHAAVGNVRVCDSPQVIHEPQEDKTVATPRNASLAVSNAARCVIDNMALVTADQKALSLDKEQCMLHSLSMVYGCWGRLARVPDQIRQICRNLCIALTVPRR
ncbi:hypothetical protein DPMN_046061 [Dreissena polymorpha]|uniref:Uncharacterized protein n=1 Tax=Dreissena polymorpha TaxID=45954 RepID=A0A9D4D752_DREPO|nr:hypothetical protein DPMN_046061 [Dreissena polymorpha]